MISSPSYRDWPQYRENPFTIPLNLPAGYETQGGLLPAELSGNGYLDYLISAPGYLAAIGHFGCHMWQLDCDIQLTDCAEKNGLPGTGAAGFQIADIDGDTRPEVLFLDQQGNLQVLDARTGQQEWSAELKAPEPGLRWEHLAIADIRGLGLRDLILQCGKPDDFRLGTHVAAFALEQLMVGDAEPLWSINNYFGCAHAGAQAVDLNGDGRHELTGGAIVDCDGRTLNSVPLDANGAGNHIDGVLIGKVLKDRTGPELVILEEGGENRIFLNRYEGIVWESHCHHRQADFAAIGHFLANEDNAQIWCRSAYDCPEPFVLNHRGEVIAEYEWSDTAAGTPFASGIHQVQSVQWEPNGKHQLCGLGNDGDILLFDALNGKPLAQLSGKAKRIQVADISGDPREEILAINDVGLTIHHHPQRHCDICNRRLWEHPYYRARKRYNSFYSG